MWFGILKLITVVSLITYGVYHDIMLLSVGGAGVFILSNVWAFVLDARKLKTSLANEQAGELEQQSSRIEEVVALAWNALPFLGLLLSLYGDIEANYAAYFSGLALWIYAFLQYLVAGFVFENVTGKRLVMTHQGWKRNHPKQLGTDTRIRYRDDSDVK